MTKTIINAAILAAIFALPAIAILRPVKAHASYCTTTCYGSGYSRTCNTYCN